LDWNVDSNDWQQRDADLVYQNVTSTVERLDFPDELIILFHEHPWTVEALPRILDYLEYHGYTFVTSISKDQ
jgi:peptidoglycan/xylan/chitin deacetylase (PgdA/CDA1 family)